MKKPAVFHAALISVGLVLCAPVSAQLITGVSLNSVGTNDDVFDIDPATDVATSILNLIPVWGATYDAANERVLFTTDGDSAPIVADEDLLETEGTVGGSPMLAYDPATGTTSFVGNVMDVAGAEFRIDGLAISNGVLYGSRAANATDGIFSIDMGTLVATMVIPLTDSISGIDADPETGTIYGVNDTTGMVVTIDPGAGTVTPFAAYPDPNETDLDGIAVGNGKAYLIPDDSDPGLIYVLDLATVTYDTPLTAPWGGADNIFSGGALIVVAPSVLEVPTLGYAGLALLALLLAGAMIGVHRRRTA